MSGFTYVRGGYTKTIPAGLTDEPMLQATIDDINAKLDNVVELRLVSAGAWSYSIGGGDAISVIADKAVIIPGIDFHDAERNMDSSLKFTNGSPISALILGSPTDHGNI